MPSEEDTRKEAAALGWKHPVNNRAVSFDLDQTRRIYVDATDQQSVGPDSGINQAFADEVIRSLQRQARFVPINFAATTAATLLQSQQKRRYLIIQNTSATGILYLGFGYSPTSTTGLIIQAGGYYEPFQIPDNDIFMLGSIASVTGVMLFAN